MVKKTIRQMKEELKQLIEDCKLLDYRTIQQKGLIRIDIVTSDYKKYLKRNIVRSPQNMNIN